MAKSHAGAGETQRPAPAGIGWVDSCTDFIDRNHVRSAVLDVRQRDAIVEAGKTGAPDDEILVGQIGRVDVETVGAAGTLPDETAAVRSGVNAVVSSGIFVRASARN